MINNGALYHIHLMIVYCSKELVKFFYLCVPVNFNVQDISTDTGD